MSTEYTNEDSDEVVALRHATKDGPVLTVYLNKLPRVWDGILWVRGKYPVHITDSDVTMRVNRESELKAAKLGLEAVDKPVRAEELREWYSTTVPWADGVRVKRTKKEV